MKRFAIYLAFVVALGVGFVLTRQGTLEDRQSEVPIEGFSKPFHSETGDINAFSHARGHGTVQLEGSIPAHGTDYRQPLAREPRGHIPGTVPSIPRTSNRVPSRTEPVRGNPGVGGPSPTKSIPAEDGRGAIRSPYPVVSQVNPAIPSQVRIEETLVEVDVPAGAVLPAVFVNESPMSEAQNQAADRIVSAFSASIEPGRTIDLSAPESQDRWNSAVYHADEAYRSMFGQEAYLAHTLQSAKEALEEKSP